MKKDGSLPFGQWPFLQDGDVKLGQSLAITHYIAKKGNLLGDGADFGKSEMLLQEYDDIFNMLGKNQYAPDKAKSWGEFFGEEGPVAKQFVYIDKLLRADGKQFTNASKPLLGDLAMAVILDLLLNLEPSCLSKYPRLEAFTKAQLATPAFATVKDLPMYYSRS